VNAPVKGARRWVPSMPKRVVGPFNEGNLLRWVIGTGLAAFAIGYIVMTLAFFPGFGRSAIVTIPDLRGRPLAQATRTLSRLGLEIERGGSLANSRIPGGAVLVQSPLPGQEVTRGTSVRVVLSAGPERHPVPSIPGLGLARARTLLERYGFTVVVRPVISDEEVGAILGTRPAAGTTATVPGVVTITTSAGPPKMAVPDVTSLPLPEAEERLRAAGLRLGRVSYDPGSAEALGGVASQRPAAGDSLRRGGGVSVVVSGTDPDPTPEPEEPADSVATDSVPAEVEPEPAEPPAEPVAAAP
jgi:serine/threonine-protein kinase